MAQRFGGKFSPDGRQNDMRGIPAPTRHRLAGRPKWVTIAATPFLLAAFFQSPAGMVTDLSAFGMIAGGMWLTGEGLRAEAAYQIRRVARRPAIPRKLFGGIAAAAGLGLGAGEPGAWIGAGLIGAAGMALHWLAFGADPMRDKGISERDDFQMQRADRMIDEAQDYLDDMTRAIQRCGDRRLEARVAMFQSTVQDLFDHLRQDPGDLSAARRYLGVYLMGARDATVKFAELYSRRQDGAARQAYESFLDDLEKDFSAKLTHFLDGDRTDLDIEISVLRDRLAREGVRPSEPPAEPKPLQSQAAQTLDELVTEHHARDKTR
ncbi:5-bromo-4-chloroindolyl phosphate hydrolysis family protein [Paracoccus homiensis]|uniref:5-bromo-4-chloroindolyl phosphate hydrolysis family protein n=1 Tax=Paracoccus homiensis TaxID=364199 RepID=UPI00398D1F18